MHILIVLYNASSLKMGTIAQDVSVTLLALIKSFFLNLVKVQVYVLHGPVVLEGPFM